MPNTHRDRIRREATILGFDACRFTSAILPLETGARLQRAIADSHHAGMHWLADTVERRKSPGAMWPDARSAILLGVNYGPDGDPLRTLAKRDRATISVYARNRDYHDLIKGRLKTLASKLVSLTGCEVKVFVDTAPLMEKPMAAQAGLGWQGKHTNLVSREFGSWLFLGSILTTAELEPDDPETDHCGNCRACLDICPTQAFPAPYRLDARRCISYLTIEHKGMIPVEFRNAMGNRIYGCDDCLAVCPWNKFASEAREVGLKARDDLGNPSLEMLAKLDDAGFRALFSGSPIKRIGLNRFLRNVLIAIGNSGDKSMIVIVRKLLGNDDPVIRGTSVWALSRLLDRKDLVVVAGEVQEHDPVVQAEWAMALETARKNR
ncbi:MAG: tRNA epoxyqueuosine(34) reductase QueG [Nitratireductor sp.]